MTALHAMLWCLPAFASMAQDSLHRGIALDRAGKYQQANRLLTAAARATATPKALNNLAVNLVHLGRVPEAIATFEQVLSFDPNNASALFNVGSLYAATGQWDLAIARLEAMLHWSPHDDVAGQKLALAHQGKAEAMLRAGKLQESLPELQSAIDLAPGDASLYVALSLALLLGNAVTEAVTLLQDASRKFPDNARIALALGYAYEGEHDWESAAQWYLQALDSNPRAAIIQVAAEHESDIFSRLEKTRRHTEDADLEQSLKRQPAP